MNQQVASIDQVKNTVVDLAIRFGPRLLAAILILVIGFMTSRWVSRWLERALTRIDLEPPVRLLLARIAWALSLTLFVIMALQNLGVELLPLIAGLGVAGAGLALGATGCCFPFDFVFTDVVTADTVVAVGAVTARTCDPSAVLGTRNVTLKPPRLLLVKLGIPAVAPSQVRTSRVRRGND